MNKTLHRTGMILAVIFAAAAAAGVLTMTRGKQDADKPQEVYPAVGDIHKIISTTGTVKPQNRLEIKPPIAGRVEQILVREGQKVTAGEVLALMSSSDRAALLDAAKLKGDQEVTYWQEVYKAAPLIAPIDGEVIVRAVEPGQTVMTSDAVLVLSDRLIVKADVDETDIGDIKVGQTAVISLDAYADIKAQGVVDHISYESQLVNNVTIYEVDILPDNIPDVFRSGMSANVEVVVSQKSGVLLLPLAAVDSGDDGASVSVKDPKTGKISSRPIVTGLKDDKNVEVLSGITDGDLVVFSEVSVLPQKSKRGTNPFMPQRGPRNRETR